MLADALAACDQPGAEHSGGADTGMDFGVRLLALASTSRSQSTAGLIPVAGKGPTSAVTSSDLSGSLVAGRR